MFARMLVVGFVPTTHPGGNMTGVNLLLAEVVEKRLDLLREMVPAARRLAVLINPADAKSFRNHSARRG